MSTELHAIIVMVYNYNHYYSYVISATVQKTIIIHRTITKVSSYHSVESKLKHSSKHNTRTQEQCSNVNREAIILKDNK